MIRKKSDIKDLYNIYSRELFDKKDNSKDRVTWNNVKPLKETDAIEKFENKYGFEFPFNFKSFVEKYNGGSPSLKHFDLPFTKDTKEFKSLLSFNKNDPDSIYKTYDRLDSKLNIIPVASCSNGDYIVFERTHSTNFNNTYTSVDLGSGVSYGGGKINNPVSNNLYYWDHKKDETITLSNSFNMFVMTLKK